MEYVSMKKLCSEVIILAYTDYMSSRSMLRELEIESYLDSSTFLEHCQIACANPEVFRDKILSDKKHHHRDSCITVYMLCLTLHLNYEVVKAWCKECGNVCYINGWSEPRLRYDQAKKVIEEFVR